MAGHLCLMACDVFEKEMRAVSGMPEFRDIQLHVVPARCDHFEGSWDGLVHAVGARSKEGQAVCLIGGFCLAQASNHSAPPAACAVFQKGHCAEWVADKDVIDHFLGHETLLVLPGWLKNWERHVDGRWPEDRKEAQAFYRDIGKKVVLLDTGVHHNIAKDLREFARFLRLPCETHPAGLGYFRLSAAQPAHAWRLEREREAGEAKLAGIKQTISDYARMGPLLEGLSRARTEDEARSCVLEAFRVLVSPQNIAYRDASAAATASRVEGSPLDRILSLNADYAWTDDRDGFFLRVSNGAGTVGVLEIEGLAVPGRGDQDLGLSLALARIMGLALAKVHGESALRGEQDRSQATGAALAVSEERVRSIFEGTPVGLYRTTPAGQIVDANPALARMLGFAGPEALKTVNSWDLHLNPGDRESWQSVLEGVQAAEAFEYQLRRRDGNVIWVRDTARAVRDRNGQVVFYEGALEDVTRRKQTEAAYSWSQQLRMSLAEVSERLLAPGSIEDMSALLLQHVRRLTSSQTCFVAYIHYKTGKLVAGAMTDDAREMRNRHPEAGLEPGEGAGLWGWVLKNKKPILANLPTLDPRFQGLPEWHFPVCQFLCVPAVMSGTLVGLLAAANSDRTYSEKDVDAVERLATLFAVSIYRSRAEEELRELSLVDELTGLHNRRGFMTLAEQQSRVANRSKKEMFLLYADLDDLKKINDRLGHGAGDEALVETAGILREAFRESDIIARVGGDEFVVLAIEAGEAKAEALRRRVEERFVAWNARPGRRFTLAASLGVVRYNPGQPCSIPDLMAEADKRMYAEKAAGKSRQT